VSAKQIMDGAPPPDQHADRIKPALARSLHKEGPGPSRTASHRTTRGSSCLALAPARAGHKRAAGGVI